MPMYIQGLFCFYIWSYSGCPEPHYYFYPKVGSDLLPCISCPVHDRHLDTNKLGKRKHYQQQMQQYGQII